jgi:hypothetical protein
MLEMIEQADLLQQDVKINEINLEIATILGETS